MLVNRYLTAFLFCCEASAFSFKRQTASVNSILNTLSQKVLPASVNMLTLRNQDRESDVTVGNLINTFDNALNQAISSFQNLRNTPNGDTDTQVKEANIIQLMVTPLAGLDPTEVPSLPKLLLPFDSLLASEITQFNTKNGAVNLTSKLVIEQQPFMVQLNLTKTLTALGLNTTLS